MAYRKVDPGLAKGFEEQFTIGIILKNVLAPIATVHHVINGSFVLNAQLTSHGETLNRGASLVKSVIYLGPTPFREVKVPPPGGGGARKVLVLCWFCTRVFKVQSGGAAAPTPLTLQNGTSNLPCLLYVCLLQFC